MPGLAPGVPVGSKLSLQIGSSVARRPTKMGSPMRPAAGNVSSLVAAIRMGGCGTDRDAGATVAFCTR